MRDFRHAVRFLWTQKRFSAAAVLTLAIGLGANTALYGFVNTALRPLDVPRADQIVSIAAEARGDETGGFQYTFSLDTLKDLQRRTTSVADVFGLAARIGGLAVDGRASHFWFAGVTDNYFDALGVRAEAGRLIERSTGSPAAIILGHSFWKRVFGGDRGVIGKAVRVNGQPAVIAGVVPQSFHGTLMAIELDGYVSIDDFAVVAPDTKRWLYHNRKARPMQVWGRLKDGVTLPIAQAAVNDVMRAFEAEYPASDAGVSARVLPETMARPLPMRAVTDAIPRIRFLAMALAGLVLLLACMNVANLLFARATARRREMAIRSALGATRWRLVRQMVVEALVLSGLGGLAGLALGQWATVRLLGRLDIGADMPLHLETAFDRGVFLYAFVAAAVTGVGIGVWTAWRVSRADAREALQDGGKGLSEGIDRQRVRRVLVVGQIAGSLALLIAASLFVRTLMAAQRIDLGFDAAHLLTVRLDPRQIGFDDIRTVDFFDDLQRRVGAWPEVRSVGMAFTTPMSYLVGGGGIYLEGEPPPANGQPPATFINRVGRRYFETMDIPIVRGRPFVEDDEHETATTRRYAIVNETMAAKFWPGQEPIGKRFRLFNPDEPLLEVVGVARDSKYVLVFEAPRPFIYLPLERDISLRTLHVRTYGDPALLAPRLEREIREMAPDLPLADLRTMEQSLAGLFGYLIFRMGAVQAGGMGLLGVILAMVGVYGVVSFDASLRIREIGIRVALGAQPRDVRRLVVGQGIRLVAIGTAIGGLIAFAAARLLAQFFPLVDLSDWGTFAVVAAVLVTLALWACYLPAWRVTRMPVTNALRQE
jgi:predicted permease